MEKRIYFGTAGWSYPDWDNIVYPKSEKNKLKFVSSYLDCLEINTTFYQIVKPEIIKSWIKSTSDKQSFRFSIKLWQGFTHQHSMYSKNDVDKFKESIAPLKDFSEEKPWLLIQFPFYTEYNKRSYEKVEHILNDFQNYSCMLELRHSSFDNQDFYSLVKSYHASICLLDYPLSKVSFNPVQSNSDFCYYRLHGRNYSDWFKKDSPRDNKYNYMYNLNEIDEITKRIKEILQHIKTLVLITNNHYKGQAFANALELKSKLIEEKVDIPPMLQKNYRRLHDIAKNPITSEDVKKIESEQLNLFG